MSLLTSVVITTYEDDLRLEITLRAFQRQQAPRPFDVIVVNDGGSPKTKEMMQKLWSPDGPRLHYYYLDPPSTDFRLAAARNLGLQHAMGDQTIICDCDTAPAPDMVAQHQQNFVRDTVLIGIRKRIRRESVEMASHFHSLAQVDQHWMDLNVYQEDERLRYPRYLQVQDSKTPWTVCWGCNFSFATSHACRIGGFDTEFVGWGGEDEDLARRFFRMGMKFKAIPQSIVYHLDHAQRTTQNASETFRRKFDGEIQRGPSLLLKPSTKGIQ